MSRQGFTLVEVLVALALAGVVALMVHRGVRTVVEVERRASEARAASAHAVAVRRQLVSWLGGAAVEGTLDAWDFEGAAGLAEDGSPDAVLTFTTAAPGPFESGRSRIVLGVERDPATPESGVVARQLIGPGAVPHWTLAPTATGLAIRYLHTVDGERVWTTEWRSSAQLPEAIEVRLLGDSLPPLLHIPVFVVPRGGM